MNYALIFLVLSNLMVTIFVVSSCSTILVQQKKIMDLFDKIILNYSKSVNDDE